MITGQNLQIRRYQNADKDTVWNLHVDALKAVGAYAGNGPWNADLLDIEKSYFKNNGHFLVVECDTQIVGMGALRRIDDQTAEIKRMRVRPDCQKRGIGKQILLALEQKARALGYSKIILDTSVVQTSAQRLYERHGYQVFKTGVLGGLDTFFYQKSLVSENMDSISL